MDNITILYDLFLQSSGVSTDTRKIQNGHIFFGLKGDTFDGNQYAAKALELGALTVVVDDAKVVKDERYFLVENVLEALQELARFHRDQFDIPVIGLTGSNGKTTTKELISLVLLKRYKTHFTFGNLNNHIGVPLTILGMPNETEVAVIEMGANHQGEIGFLSTISKPTHGLITNIGKAHLEGFGGIEGVKKGKSELYKYLNKPRGVAFVNIDEPFLYDLSDGVQYRITYGTTSKYKSENVDFFCHCISSSTNLTVEFPAENGGSCLVKTQLIGRYNLGNVITAIALGKYFKISSKDIRDAIESYVPENNRSELRKLGSNTIFLDAYNANPTSMEQSLRSFAEQDFPYKIAILGDMFELGDESKEEHRNMVNLALGLSGINELVFVGKEFEKVKDNKETIGTWIRDIETLRGWFKFKQPENVAILIKGSRGMSLEKLFS
jgi:UDP-N-acetylmuramoyl-tripeptide--D-alanyl-D-alanine ligase